MLAEEVRRKVHLVDLCDVFELQLLIKRDLKLWLQIVSAEVELDLGVLVADEFLFFVNDGVCEGGVEGVLEDWLRLGIRRLAVEVDEEALGRAGDPFTVVSRRNLRWWCNRTDLYSHSSRSILIGFREVDR